MPFSYSFHSRLTLAHTDLIPISFLHIFHKRSPIPVATFVPVPVSTNYHLSNPECLSIIGVRTSDLTFLLCASCLSTKNNVSVSVVFIVFRYEVLAVSYVEKISYLQIKKKRKAIYYSSVLYVEFTGLQFHKQCLFVIYDNFIFYLLNINNKVRSIFS
jgi:hypothetical protein